MLRTKGKVPYDAIEEKRIEVKLLGTDVPFMNPNDYTRNEMKKLLANEDKIKLTGWNLKLMKL